MLTEIRKRTWFDDCAQVIEQLFLMERQLLVVTQYFSCIRVLSRQLVSALNATRKAGTRRELHRECLLGNVDDRFLAAHLGTIDRFYFLAAEA